MIPLCDVKLQYQVLKDEIDAALQQAALAGQYILGPNVKAFEAEFAAYQQCPHAAGVGNGTDALHLALRALGVGPGHEVITTPFTFIATAEAISLVGATPVFVDIDPQTFNIDPALIEPAVTRRTRAILPVHLYGQPCDMDAIMSIAARHGLSVVEDCAQACGATYKGRKVGTFGDAGCFSFFPSKNLGGLGDGGMVTANERSLYERIEMLRRHGGRVKYHHEEVGLNSRLDELQAAVLRIKLRHLDHWNALRRERAYRYNELLATIGELTCPRERDGVTCNIPQPRQTNRTATTVYHQYTLRHADRDALMARLKDDGVGSMIYYPVPLHLQKAYASLGYSEGSFPHAEQAARTCFSIPMFPELSDAQQQQVADSLRSATAAAGPQMQQRAA